MRLGWVMGLGRKTTGVGCPFQPSYQGCLLPSGLVTLAPGRGPAPLQDAFPSVLHSLTPQGPVLGLPYGTVHYGNAKPVQAWHTVGA